MAVSESNSSSESEDSRFRRERATDELRIVVLSGPSGTGKSTIVNRLAAQREVKLIKAISATTRAAREQERDGEDYYFLGQDEFLRRRAVDELVQKKYIDRNKTAITGGSAGGMTLGAILNMRPNISRAALPTTGFRRRVPMSVSSNGEWPMSPVVHTVWQSSTARRPCNLR